VANGVQMTAGADEPILNLSTSNLGQSQLYVPVTIKASYQNGLSEISVTITITFTRIEFSENPSQMYGFDPNKQSEKYYSSYISGIAWKSIQINETDIFNVDILPSTAYPLVTIHSSFDISFPVTPEIPSGSSQVLTAGANILGTAYVYPNLEGQEAPCAVEGAVSQVNLASYAPKTRMVKFIVVQEEDDDVQNIDKGEQGNQYEICISPGQNNFLDTPKDTSNDDQLVNNDLYLNTGVNGFCDTDSWDENTNYSMAADVDVNAAIALLNEIYKGAAFQWESNPLQLDTIKVNYDTDGDGKLDIPETEVITQNSCCPKDPDISYVFFVDNIQVVPGNDPDGFSL
jgi:hypothetical protein